MTANPACTATDSDVSAVAEVETDAVVVDPSVMDPVLENLAAVSAERLEAAIGAGAARIAALQCKWLLLLAEFVVRRGFDRWGMSAEHWLSWRCGLDRVTAREHLRVAAALTVLPAIQAAFAEGRLSYSKVRAITRVATEHDEQAWVDTAIGLPAAKLARLTGQYRTITRETEQNQTQAQTLTWKWDQDGMVVGSFRLAPDQGAAFIAAIHTQQSSMTVNPVDSAASTDPVPQEVSPVDALLQLVHGGSTPEPGLLAATQPEVVLHVSVGDLASNHASLTDVSYPPCDPRAAHNGRH